MKLMTAIGLSWLGILSTGLVACGDRAGNTPPPPAPAPAAQEPAPAVEQGPHEIAAADAPAAVTAALSRARPGLKIIRVTEHERGNGLVLYEFSGTGADGNDMKVEVKYDGKLAEVLTPEPSR